MIATRVVHLPFLSLAPSSLSSISRFFFFLSFVESKSTWCLGLSGRSFISGTGIFLLSLTITLRNGLYLDQLCPIPIFSPPLPAALPSPWFSPAGNRVLRLSYAGHHSPPLFVGLSLDFSFPPSCIRCLITLFLLLSRFVKHSITDC